MEEKIYIKLQNDFPDTHYLLYKEVKYPIKIEYFKLSSKYFQRNKEELEGTEAIMINNEGRESEEMTISSSTIQEFIQYVQHQQISLHQSNVIGLKKLSEIFEVDELKEITQDCIKRNQKELVLDLLLQNSTNQDNAFYEEIIADDISHFIDDNRLLDLKVPTLYRIFKKNNEKLMNKTKETKQKINKFIFNFFDKNDRKSSVLFAFLENDELTNGQMKLILNDYYDRIDFEFINKSFCKKIYSLLEYERKLNKQKSEIIDKMKENQENERILHSQEKSDLEERMTKEMKIKENEYRSKMKAKDIENQQLRKEKDQERLMHEEEIKQMKKENETEKKKHEEEIKQMKKEINNMKKENETEKKKHEEEIKQMKKENETEKKKHEEEIKQMKKEINNMKKENETEKKKHEEEITEIKKENESMLKQIKELNESILIKKFDYTSGKEFNGIIKYLTKQAGGNIHDKGIINVTSNSISRHPKNLLELDNDYYEALQGASNIWICFNFKNMEVEVSNYSIKSSTCSKNIGHIKSWKIEISRDCKSWETIDEHSNSNELNGRTIIKTFSTKPNHFSRYIRFYHIGSYWGSDSEYWLQINSIEFYGRLKQIES